MREALRRLMVIWYWFALVAMSGLIWLYYVEDGHKWAASKLDFFAPLFASGLMLLMVASLAKEGSQDTSDNSLFSPGIGWAAWFAVASIPVGVGIGIALVFAGYQAHFGGARDILSTAASEWGFIGRLVVAAVPAVLTPIVVFVPLATLEWVVGGFRSERA